MNKKIKNVYVGLPEHLIDNILWVKREARTNPLSHRPGGFDVVVEYHSGKVYGYDWIKMPPRYIEKFCPEWTNTSDDDFSEMSEEQQLEITKKYIARIYAREKGEDNNNESPFVEFWNSEKSNDMPWNSFQRMFPNGSIKNSTNLYLDQGDDYYNQEKFERTIENYTQAQKQHLRRLARLWFDIKFEGSGVKSYSLPREDANEILADEELKALVRSANERFKEPLVSKRTISAMGLGIFTVLVNVRGGRIVRGPIYNHDSALTENGELAKKKGQAHQTAFDVHKKAANQSKPIAIPSWGFLGVFNQNGEITDRTKVEYRGTSKTPGKYGNEYQIDIELCNLDVDQVQNYILDLIGEEDGLFEVTLLGFLKYVKPGVNKSYVVKDGKTERAFSDKDLNLKSGKGFLLYVGLSAFTATAQPFHENPLERKDAAFLEESRKRANETYRKALERRYGKERNEELDREFRQAFKRVKDAPAELGQQSEANKDKTEEVSTEVQQASVSSKSSEGTSCKVFGQELSESWVVALAHGITYENCYLKALKEGKTGDVYDDALQEVFKVKAGSEQAQQLQNFLKTYETVEEYIDDFDEEDDQSLDEDEDEVAGSDPLNDDNSNSESSEVEDPLSSSNQQPTADSPSSSESSEQSVERGPSKEKVRELKARLKAKAQAKAEQQQEANQASSQTSEGDDTEVQGRVSETKDDKGASFMAGPSD